MGHTMFVDPFMFLLLPVLSHDSHGHLEFSRWHLFFSFGLLAVNHAPRPCNMNGSGQGFWGVQDGPGAAVVDLDWIIGFEAVGHHKPNSCHNMGMVRYACS